MKELVEQVLFEAIERFGDVEVARQFTTAFFLEAYDQINAEAGS